MILVLPTRSSEMLFGILRVHIDSDTSSGWSGMIDFLPTKMCRGFGGDTASCDLCGACEDSIHVLRDCPFATDIWRVLIPPAFNNEFFGTLLKPKPQAQAL